MDVDLDQHRRRDLAGERALSSLSACSARTPRRASRASSRPSPRAQERRADRDVDAVGGRDSRQQRLDELLGLGDRLVHLPVAGDQRRPSRAHASASTPGSVLPSISSSDAPPPVERCVTWSASPNWSSAAAESPPPTTVTPGRGGDGLGDGAGAGGERLELERAHRPVPEHGAGVGDHVARTRRAVRGPMSSPISPSGTSTPSSGCGRARRRRGGRRRPGRRAAASFARPGEPSSARRRARRPRRAHSERADSVALRRRGTGSTSRRRSGPCRRARGSARSPRSCRSPWRRRAPRRAGAPGAASRSVSAVTSRSSSKPAACSGSEPRDALGRRVRAVGGAERVVDVDVGQRRERGRELGVVRRLAGLEADVLEHEHVAPAEVVGERADVVADDAGRERHVGAGQLGEPVGDRPQRERRLAVLRAGRGARRARAARRGGAAPRSSAAPRGSACRR